MGMVLKSARAVFFSTCLLGGFLFAADWETAAEFRRADEYSKAENAVRKYASPAGYEQLKPAEQIDFLRGLLELAHIRALQDDVSGALSLLNWAEGLQDPFQRSLSCVKYAEILLDLGEFERADGYLKNVDELIRSRASSTQDGAAIGQGGTVADTGAVWRELRDEADALKAEVEAEAMKQKFGATYGSYVKLRRLQVLVRRSKRPRYQKEALRVADEIIETDPASQFAAAAGYLKGDLLAARLSEKSDKKQIKEVKDYLEGFVKSQPDGLYRGEALMLLGKISLEIEWDAKDAEKFYKQALDWFRKAREKRDALSLYAPVNDDLKTQILPTQRPTTLNQWKRIVYHDEDPLKLYNTANAPVWYMDDKEKNCVYILGFLAFADNKYEIAESYWKKLPALDPDVLSMDPRLSNVHKRLMASVKAKYMLFSSEEKKDVNQKLKLQYGELLYMLEKFPESQEIFQTFYCSEDEMDKFIGAIALAVSLSQDPVNIKMTERYFQYALAQKHYSKHILYGTAIIRYAETLIGIGGGLKKAHPLYKQYVKNFGKVGREDYVRRAEFMDVLCYIILGDKAGAMDAYRKFRRKEDVFTRSIDRKINQMKEGGNGI